MSNPGLQYIGPEPGALERWVFSHAQDHNNLIAQANTLPNVTLQYRIIDPIGVDVDQWLEDHQVLHNELGNLTGFNNADLTTVDFKDPRQRQAWIDINFAEHQTFSVALGLA
jgi:hypothetical protein